MENNNYTVSVAKLSVWSNSFLTIAKLIVGVLIGSISILSEAIHSFVDLCASFIAWFAVKKSAKPADDDHPYGHEKFENISGTIEAFLIFCAAVYIIYEAVSRLINPREIDTPAIGVLIMFISSAVNFFVSNKLFKAAKNTDSLALEADGWHLRTDVYTSFGIMLALLVISVLNFFFPEFDATFIDSLAALAVAALILKTAYSLTIKSARDLFDICLPADEVALIENIIRADKNIFGYHGLRTRKAGNKRFVEFHILVQPEMSVHDSHAITGKFKHQIEEILPKTLVMIHVEPCENICTEKCLAGCLKKKGVAHP